MQVTVSEAKAHFAGLKAAGETVIVTRHGSPPGEHHKKKVSYAGWGCGRLQRASAMASGKLQSPG